jgi:hypothetical protein
MATLGNTSGSSLMRSAASIQKTIAEIEDKQADNQWKYSAKTDDDYQVYDAYLQDKMAKLEASPTLQNISRLETLRAQRLNVSRQYSTSTLQRMSTDILAGNSTNIDKYKMIVNLYNRANSEGNYDFAQSLVGQAYSLEQKIQYDKDVADRAAEAQHAANVVANKEGYESALDMIDSMAEQFGAGLKSSSQGAITKELKKQSESLISSLKSIGVEVPENAQLNYGTIVKTLLDAKMQLYGQLEDMYRAEPNGQIKADKYAMEQQNIIDNKPGIKVGGKSFSLAEANAWEQQPNMIQFVPTGEQDLNGNMIMSPKAMPIVDYQYAEDGTLIPVYSSVTGGKVGSTKGIFNKELTDIADSKQGEQNRNMIQKELEGLGFSNIDINPETGDITAKSSDDPTNAVFNDALRKLGINTTDGKVGQSEIRLIKKGTGYVLNPMMDNEGRNRSLYLSIDEKGKAAIYDTKYDFATKQPSYNLITKSDPTYNTLKNSTTELGTGQNAAWAIANAKSEQLQPNTLAGARFMKDMADKYYNGDQNAAWEDVSRAQTGKQAAVVQQTIRSNITSPQPYPTLVAPAPTPTPTYQLTPINKVNTSLTPSFMNKQPDLVKDILPEVSNMFKGYGTIMRQGYTESNIIPEIAKKFYGGDKQKAADVVYKYRKDVYGN